MIDTYKAMLDLVLFFLTIINILIFVYYDIVGNDVKAVKHSVVAVMMMVALQGLTQ